MGLLDISAETSNCIPMRWWNSAVSCGDPTTEDNFDSVQTS